MPTRIMRVCLDLAFSFLGMLGRFAQKLLEIATNCHNKKNAHQRVPGLGKTLMSVSGIQALTRNFAA